MFNLIRSRLNSTSTLSYSSTKESLVSSSKRLRQTSMPLVLSPKICMLLDDMDQTTSGDQLFDTTIVEGLTDDVCFSQYCKSPQNFSSSHRLPRILVSVVGVGYSCSKVIGNLSRNSSFRTLVPMNRPSSEPLPLVFAKR